MYMYKDSSSSSSTSTSTILAAAAAYAADMESGGYLYGYTTGYNNISPSLREGLFRPTSPSASLVLDQTASDSFTTAAADDVAVASHHRGLGVYQLDPHLPCLKLGKRHYFDDSDDVAPYQELSRSGFSTGDKKGKPPYNYGSASNNIGPSSATTAAAAVTRCQADGCHAPLVSAKEYHRRHKVCEVHAKAAKVAVLGADQRFCQQCSRFHGVSEFDESKRSCRRRLAGHNERRRKSSQNDSVSGRALSLLSSRATNYYNNAYTMIRESDLSSRSSAALRDLIAEHRATTSILARHHRHYHNNYWPPRSFEGEEASGRQVMTTLDLMQTPPRPSPSSTTFGLLSLHQNTTNIIKAKDEAESCSELWNVNNSFNNLM